MPTLNARGRRIAITLLPLVFAALHVLGVLPLGMLHRLDDLIYDARLRATMPGTLDERVVIIDIDEKSLAEVGRWPWPRHRVAQLVDTLFDRHGVALLGFDTVFAEPDESAGLGPLRELARGALADVPAFGERLRQLEPSLDRDARLARALQGRPVVLGYYFTSDRDGRTSGVLPPPALACDALTARRVPITHWDGFGASIAPLAAAAPRAGFFNFLTSGDGVVRSLPLLAEHGGACYEALSLAMFRLLLGSPAVEPGFPSDAWLDSGAAALESVRLRAGAQAVSIRVDERVAALVPFRGPGGPRGGSFLYLSAADVLAERIEPSGLHGKIVLVGSSAPGLLDLRTTPVGEAYPGVETHANLIAGLLDGPLPNRPDYAAGYELLVLALAGLTLAFVLPLLSAFWAVLVSAAVVALVTALNFWLYLSHGLVLPLATTLVMAGLAFALNMSYGYFVESRSKRELAQLFGTYVPPALVTEMVKDPGRYSMAARERELTVMFCDMRGFTQIAEGMSPTDLQGLLHTVFSRLTQLIRQHLGTIDKYMGDCVMAFWGAPVESGQHAQQAVGAALDMVQAIAGINRERRAAGEAAIGIGIGLNSGAMSVGDMGSDVRRSYTVIGDAVNLGSRLEALSRVYGVDIVASASTVALAPGFVWQPLDRVRVKGKAQSVDIYTPLGRDGTLGAQKSGELAEWGLFRRAWLAQDWDTCDLQLGLLRQQNAQSALYRLFEERVAALRRSPPGPNWDGTTHFDSK